MISQTLDMNNDLLDKLKQNHYSRRIKSHFYSYGTKYDFSRFFLIGNEKEYLGIISVFNSSMIISTFVNKTFEENILSEIAHFILINKPSIVEFECCYAEYLKAELTLVFVSFVISLAGFYIFMFLGLNVRYPLLIALATAFVDALPILGSGTVMIPWAIISALDGNINLGIAIVRSCMIMEDVM